MATYLPNGKQQFIDPSTGAPLVGGKVWHFIPGTTTLKDTWQTPAGTSLNTNPVRLDGYGQAAIWGQGAYRQLVLDPSDNPIWDQETTSGISNVMEPVVSATTLANALTALGISPAMQPVVGASTLAAGMTALGISPVMQPVVGAPTLAQARAAMGVDAVSIVVVNVKNFGAVGDGVTNDTAAIQAAVNSISNGVVYFPPGAYLCLGTIYLKNGVSMWGNGRLQSTLLAGTNSISIFAVVASALQSGYEIRDLGFSGNGFSSVTGIYLDGVDVTRRLNLISLENVYFAALYQAVYTHFCANLFIENAFCNVCNLGVVVDNGAEVCIQNSQAQNGSGVGFTIQGGPGAADQVVRLIGCSTNGQVYGCAISDQDWGAMVGCSFSSATGGPLRINNSSNWKIVGNEFASSSGIAGCEVQGPSTLLHFSSNFFSLSGHGLVLTGARHTAVGNTFVANSLTDVDLQASQCSLTANICDSAAVAISIQETFAANFNAVSSNVTNGTVVLTGANSVATGNVLY